MSFELSEEDFYENKFNALSDHNTKFIVSSEAAVNNSIRQETIQRNNNEYKLKINNIMSEIKDICNEIREIKGIINEVKRVVDNIIISVGERKINIRHNIAESIYDNSIKLNEIHQTMYVVNSYSKQIENENMSFASYLIICVLTLTLAGVLSAIGFIGIHQSSDEIDSRYIVSVGFGIAFVIISAYLIFLICKKYKNNSIREVNDNELLASIRNTVQNIDSSIEQILNKNKKRQI